MVAVSERGSAARESASALKQRSRKERAAEATKEGASAEASDAVAALNAREVPAIGEEGHSMSSARAE
jgi:hypothetical protein